MSDSILSTPPKKDSSSRSILVVAVIAVGLIVALVIWRSMATPAQPPPPAPTPPPPKPAVAQPAIEPPPPPPEEIPEPPKPAPAPVEAPKPGPKRNPGCDGECNGTAPIELHQALQVKAGQARSCYERALTHNAGLAGNLLINVRIAPNGEACTASVGNDTLGDPAVSNCIVQRFRSGKFPKPAGGCVDAAVPIKLVPGR